MNRFVLSLMVLFLFGCSGVETWSSEKGDGEIILRAKDKEIKFAVKGELADTYRVLSLKPAKQDIEKDNGVVAILWGILLSKVPENKPLSKSDIKQGEMFNLIPSDEQMHKQIMKMAKNKKGCWKTIEIEAERVVKVSENGQETNIDLGFLYLNEIEGSW